MARYFLDTSALIKRYHQENGTAALELLFSGAEHRFFISRLALVEVHSSFARLVREGVFTEAEFRKLIERLDADVAVGLLKVAAVSSHRLAEASIILGTHGLKNTIRSLDAIHLATAQALHKRSPIAAFIAADKRLLSVASTACSLTVVEVS